MERPESIYPQQKGVFYLNQPSDYQEFESLYLNVRKKESRIFPDSETERLPYATATNPHQKEWHRRIGSMERFLDYLKGVLRPENVLDLGCGNGWLTDKIAMLQGTQVWGLDLNLPELEQAARVFSRGNLSFCFGDIFKDRFPGGYFDCIVLNSVVQYFPDIRLLLDRSLYLLAIDGEIHILDSPFYSEGEDQAAKYRSMAYYRDLGFPEMADHYFHHRHAELKSFHPKYMFRPESPLVKIKSMLGKPDSPFPWIRIKKKGK